MEALPQPVIATAADLLDDLLAAGTLTVAQVVDAIYMYEDRGRRYPGGELEIRSDGQVRHLRDDGEEIDPLPGAIVPSSTYRHQIAAW